MWFAIVFTMDSGRGGEAGEAISDGIGEAKDPGHLAKCRSRPVGDDVGGHGRTTGGVFPVDMLDDGFASFTGREIYVDIWPGLAVFGEEAFEEEIVADGITGGDFKAVANCRVGGRATSLAENALGPGKLDQFPDDEEVA